MNFRTGCKLLIAGLILIASAVARAQVNPDSVFQLDGAAQQNTSWNQCFYTGQCDFWDLINGAGNTSATGGPGATLVNLPGTPHDSVSTFVYGGGMTPSFTGGGSKDPIDIPSWSCAVTPTPNKDTLTNGYAAAYSDTDLVLAFGADRLSTSGDANIGIWFFQQGVYCDPSSGHFVTKPGGATLSTHVNNDVLIVSSFTGGGTTPTVAVYVWDTVHCANAKHTSSPVAGSCADSNLMTRFIGNAACSTGLGSASSPITTGGAAAGACAVTNEGDIHTTWPYPTSASASTGTYPGIVNPVIPTWTIPAQAFFTGGIDVSALLGTSPCFTSFLEDTRSSQSTSAVLKDFLGGNFPVCGLGVLKSCGTGTSSTDPGNGAMAPVLNSTGTSITYQWIATVKNTGQGTLTNVALNDTLTGATVNPPSVSQLAGGATTSFIVSYNSTSTTVTNTTSASASAGGTPIYSTDGSGYKASDTATCMLPQTGAIDVHKHCTAGAGLACGSSGCVVNIPVSAHVCNNGKTQLTNISLSDSPTATFLPNNLTLNGGDCTGVVPTNPVSCDTSHPCTTAGYTCSTAGVCTPPPNPTATYTPTSMDLDAHGNPIFPFTFTDTVSVTGATATVGNSPGAGAMCANGAQACNTVACPLCATGECSALP